MAVLGLGSDTFYLAKSVLRSSLVVHAVMGHISSPTAQDIVFGKSTALELLVLGEDGSLRSVWEQAVFGTIRDLKVLPWNKDVRHATPQVYGRDLLAVLSDSGHLSFVTFCTDAHRFLAISHVHLANSGFARRDLGWLLAVEQRGQAIAVAALKNRVAVFPVVRAANNSIIRKEDGIEYPQREYVWRGVPVKSLKPDVLGCVWSLSFVETHNEQEADCSGGGSSEDERGCLTLAAVVYRQGDAGSKVVIFTCGLAPNRPGFGLQLAAVVSLPGDEVSFSPLQLTGVPGMVGGVLVARSSDLVLVDASQPRSSKVVAVAALPGAAPGRRGGKGGDKNSKEETLAGCSPDFSRADASKPRSSRMATAASQAGAAPGRRGGKADGDSTKEEARRCKSHALRGVASQDSPLETNNGPAECEGVVESWEEMVDSEDNDMGSARKAGASCVDAVLISAWSWEPLRQQDGEEWGNHHQHDESEHALEGGFDSCMEDQDALRPESTWPHLCICAGGLYMVEMAVKKGGRAGSCGDGRTDVVVEGEGCSDIEIVVKDCGYLVENGSSALLWAERDLIVVLEHMGDGHVLRVRGVSGGTSLLEEAVVQNLSPVLDFQLIDFYGERQDQMFACCGFGKEGSLRMIRNGWSVDRLMTTPAVYDGIVGMWSLKMNARDEYHSFLVMSFVKDTRVMKIGLSFEDNTDAVGFCPGEQTLACGRIEDGWLAQVCPNGVCICAPAADSLAIDSNEGLPMPTVVTWSSPQSAGISMGAVGGGVVVVASSCPLGELIVLRVMVTAAGSRELVPTERRRIAAELSCISIPWEEIPASAVAPGGGPAVPTELYGPVRYDARQVCLVGTYEPTVEVLSLEPGKNLPTVGVAPLVSNVPSGVGLGGFVPESIRLVQFDKLYVLVGLRNGMLLHYEWPSPVMPSVVVQPASRDVPSSTAYFPPAYFSRTEAGDQNRPDDGGSQLANMCMSERGLASNVSLGTGEASELWCEASENASFGREGIRQSESGGPVVLDGKGDDVVPSKSVVVLRLALMRRIGMSPVALVPLRPMVRSDVVALNDRPWLLQAARHSQRVSYTSIAFCPSTHAAPVSFAECPEGLIFAADRALHLVAVGQTKHMYAQKLMLGDTPWRLVYHPPSRLLLVICSCGKGNSRTQQFEIRGIDPASGSVLCSFQLKKGERALCMQLWTPSPETVLVAVGTVKESSLEIEPSNEKSRYRISAAEVLIRTFSI